MDSRTVMPGRSCPDGDGLPYGVAQSVTVMSSGPPGGGVLLPPG